MKHTGVFLLFIALVALPALCLGADTLKLKYVGSIYTDAGGTGLRSPEGVTLAGDALLVSDSANKRIVRYAYKDGVVKPDTSFSVPKMYPLMVQVTSKGEMLVVDGRERAIFVLGKDGGFKGRFEPKGVPGAGTLVPRSLKIDESGAIYILDIFSDRVLILSSDGQFQKQIPFPDEAVFCTDLAVDRQGNIVLLDSVKGAVYQAKKGESNFSRLAGNLKANMNFPTGIASDNKGDLFLVDQYGSGLAVIGMDGAFLGRKLGMGWADSFLYYPSAISMGPAGEIFIADKGNNRVQQFMIVE